MIDLLNLDEGKAYMTILKQGQEDINNINIIILLLLYLEGPTFVMWSCLVN